MASQLAPANTRMLTYTQIIVFRRDQRILPVRRNEESRRKETIKCNMAGLDSSKVILLQGSRSTQTSIINTRQLATWDWTPNLAWLQDKSSQWQVEWTPSITAKAHSFTWLASNLRCQTVSYSSTRWTKATEEATVVAKELTTVASSSSHVMHTTSSIRTTLASSRI